MELGLAPDDRIVVLGSSGWFGREFAAMRTEAALVGATVREVPGPSAGLLVSDEELVAFEPTVVLNFAFLTRERVESEGLSEFKRINSALSERFLNLTRADSVRFTLTVSSGAAVTEPELPYGQMKLAEETAALRLVNSERSVVVLRAYSVSGGYVRRPEAYAFSDFILQAARGAVEVNADRPVYRRYCSVTDSLAIAINRGLAGESGILETGGDLVEMGELASAIVQVVNPEARINRRELVSEEPSSYHSDDVSWQRWSAAAGLQPMGLMEQIEATANVLLNPR